MHSCNHALLSVKSGVTSHCGVRLFECFSTRRWLTSRTDLTSHRSKPSALWTLGLIRGPPRRTNQVTSYSTSGIRPLCGSHGWSSSKYPPSLWSLRVHVRGSCSCLRACHSVSLGEFNTVIGVTIHHNSFYARHLINAVTHMQLISDIPLKLR